MTDLREWILSTLAGDGGPVWTEKELLRAGGRRTRARALRRTLGDLVDAGSVETVARHAYRLSMSGRTIEGVFMPDNRSGPARGSDLTGHVTDSAGDTWSVRNAAGADAGSHVIATRTARGGEVTRVLRQPRATWVGIFEKLGAGGRVTPYRDHASWAITIPRDETGSARDGEVVVVEPVAVRVKRAGRRSGSGRRARVSHTPQMPTGRVVEKLGLPGTPAAARAAVIWRHRLSAEFPESVLAEVDSLDPNHIARRGGNRKDLRDIALVTVDPETALDFDDAVFAGPMDSDALDSSSPSPRATELALRVWVAIADVAEFVSAESELDREAQYRGNSVYFPGTALPMLPERLSSDLCSLKPGVERLVLAVELEIDPSGAVSSARFFEAVMRSRARLSYAEARVIMEDASASSRLEEGSQPGAATSLASRDPEVRASLRWLAVAAERLRARRIEAGAIELEIPSTHVPVDVAGVPITFERAERSVAHRAIEEAMLAANRAVAERLAQSGVDALYRAHDSPSPERLDSLAQILASFDLSDADSGEALTRKELARALTRASEKPVSAVVNYAALRSMAQARYVAGCRPHFALGFEHYCHSTSPIRRYADLAVQRAIKATLKAGVEQRRTRRRGFAELAIRLSSCERAAASAEREVLTLMKCAYMSKHVGEVFGGAVTGVARQGLYVTLDDPFVEGLVRISRLPEFYDFDEEHFALVSRESDRVHQLGDLLSVRVVSVDVVRGWIDLAINGPEGEGDSVNRPERRRGPPPRRRTAPTPGRGPRPRSRGRRGRH